MTLVNVFRHLQSTFLGGGNKKGGRNSGGSLGMKGTQIHCPPCNCHWCNYWMGCLWRYAEWLSFKTWFSFLQIEQWAKCLPRMYSYFLTKSYTLTAGSTFACQQHFFWQQKHWAHLSAFAIPYFGNRLGRLPSNLDSIILMNWQTSAWPKSLAYKHKKHIWSHLARIKFKQRHYRTEKEASQDWCQKNSSKLNDEYQLAIELQV